MSLLHTPHVCYCMENASKETDPSPPPSPNSKDPSPMDVRSTALRVITVLACFFCLRWASAFFIPLSIGIMATYMLTPLVDWLEYKKIPRPLSAFVLVFGLLLGTTWTGYMLAGDVGGVIDTLPKAAKQLRETLLRRGEKPTPLEKVQKAAEELQKTTVAGEAPTAKKADITKVEVIRPKFNIHDYLWTGTMGLANFMGQVVTVAFLTLFLLMAGDMFRRKLVKVVSPSMERKKVTVQTLNEISKQLKRYMLVQIGTSALAGLVAGIAYAIIGLEKPVMWGVATALLHMIPYIGTLIVTGLATLMAFVQFGTLPMAGAILGASVLIHTLIGQVLVPLLTSKTSSINPVAVFVSVLAWGWLWGIWGLLLGIPITMALKAVCDKVEDLKVLGELMGN